MTYHVSDVEDMQRESRRDIIEPVQIFNRAYPHSCAIDGKHNNVLAEACSHCFLSKYEQGSVVKPWKRPT